MGNGIFGRSVINESGVQLNPPQDDSLGLGSSVIDQTAAAMIVCQRGRTDKPFWVYKNTWRNRCGHPKPLRASQLNEYALHFKEAFDSGTQAILVQRISYLPSNEVGAPNFKNDYVIIAGKLPTVPQPKPEIQVFVQSQLPTEILGEPASITSNNTFISDHTAWADEEVVPFPMTINGNFVQVDVDFTGVASMTEVAQRIESAVNTPNPLITVEFNINDGFTVTTVLVGSSASIESSVDNIMMSYMGFAENTTDVGIDGGTLPNDMVMIAAYKMKDFILDGYSVQVNFDAFNDAVITKDSIRLNLSIIDNVDSSTLYSISGAIEPSSVDESGNTRYIGDIAELFNDVFDFYEGTYPDINKTSLQDTLNASVDVNGRPIYYTLSITPTTIVNEVPFGDSAYEYSHLKLMDTTEQFEYLMGAGTQSLGLIERLALIMKERGVVFNLDVPSNLSVDDAVTWIGQFNFDPKYDHLMRRLYTPIKARNPLTNGMSMWGSSGLYTGLHCARNAIKNGYGLPAMNAPIAGESARLTRTMMRQEVTVNDVAKRKLAKARIIPVIREVYESGNWVVFFDSLSGNPKDNSFLKLASVGEMSNYLDRRIATRAKTALQNPMPVAIEQMTTFIDALLEAAKTSEWLQNSAELGGKAYEFSVTASIANPNDEMVIVFDACYVGVNRKTTITQTIKRP